MGNPTTEADHKKPAHPIAVRIAITIVGAALLLLGVAGLLLPVLPGWLLIIPGLAILAGEFVWARRLLDRAKSQLERARAYRRRNLDREAA